MLNVTLSEPIQVFRSDIKRLSFGMISHRNATATPCFGTFTFSLTMSDLPPTGHRKTLEHVSPHEELLELFSSTHKSPPDQRHYGMFMLSRQGTIIGQAVNIWVALEIPRNEPWCRGHQPGTFLQAIYYQLFAKIQRSSSIARRAC
jgi:hypothetical protein